MTDREWTDLARAKRWLEEPGWTARWAGAIGSPIEKGFKRLPADWHRRVQNATSTALLKALTMAVRTLDSADAHRSSNFTHKLLVGASGGLGGAFGLASLPLELPVSTTLILRSIADVARSEGHDLRRMDTRLACLEVFALGGNSARDDAAENGYWAVRAVLAKTVSEAASFLAGREVVEETAPAVARLISAIAGRFGSVVSESLAARAVPIAGALAGSAINVLFMNHFQNMARAHFTMKRLETVHGAEAVQAAYRSIAVPVG